MSDKATDQLLAAWAAGQDELAIAALRDGADPNVCVGRIPLALLATARRNEPVLRAVLEAGADVETRFGPENETALMMLATNARQPSDLRLIRILVEFGADVNALDRLSRTPLDHAIIGMKSTPEYLVEAAKLLVSFGARNSVMSRTHLTALAPDRSRSRHR